MGNSEVLKSTIVTLAEKNLQKINLSPQSPYSTSPYVDFNQYLHIHFAADTQAYDVFMTNFKDNHFCAAFQFLFSSLCSHMSTISFFLKVNYCNFNFLSSLFHFPLSFLFSLIVIVFSCVSIRTFGATHSYTFT